MNKIKEKQVNLLNLTENRNFINKKPRKLRFLGRFFVYFTVILVIIGLTFTYKVLLSANSLTGSAGIPSLLGQLKYLVVSSDKMLNGETEDRINILLLGMGGAGHSGGYLADTIIIASIKPSTGNVAFISVPRDLYVPIPGYDWRKINNAYAFGYAKDPKGDGGEKLITEVLEKVTGLKIQYYARADFEGFRKIIDNVKGIDVNVEQSFTDYEYPDTNFGYQPVSFKEGPNHFNGDKALQYARSRHGNNGEGSDFARSIRQQKIITALKDKVFSIYTLLNPNAILNILDSLKNHVKTNLEPWEMIRLYNMAKDFSSDKLLSTVIDNSTGGLLHSETTIDGAYILRPNAGPDNFTQIQAFCRNVFTTDNSVTESATIEIQNGTKIAGLAAKTADNMKKQNFNVVRTGNAADKTIKDTIIYDLSGGQKPLTLEALKKALNAQSSSSVPAYLYSADLDQMTYQEISAPLNATPEAKENVDFLIILGEDAKDL